jgi:predicted transcriptional regulator
MMMHRLRRRKMKRDEKRTVRTTVTVPVEDYSELEQLAEKKKVSVAWVVRDAIDSYLKSQDSEVGD